MNDFIKRFTKNIIDRTPLLNRYIIFKGTGKYKKIALTFDDGPTEHTPELLKILRENKVAANFFLLGENIAAFPRIAKQIRDEGHLIGNHTFSHADFNGLSNQQALKEIEKGFGTINAFIGDQESLFFRPPKGNIRWRLLPRLFRRNIRLIFWTVDSEDFLKLDSQKILEFLIGYHYTGGEIILLHDMIPETIKMLPNFIHFTKSKGFDFALVSELIER
ncbi:MAG: polysaccharide deacetylase family protein [Calditrichia bacterium]